MSSRKLTDKCGVVVSRIFDRASEQCPHGTLHRQPKEPADVISADHLTDDKPGPFQITKIQITKRCDQAVLRVSPALFGKEHGVTRGHYPNSGALRNLFIASSGAAMPLESGALESSTAPKEIEPPPVEPPLRRYSCRHYDVCLDLAAALNWDSFTCNGCSGEVNERLLWRARQRIKHDDVASRLCSFPEIDCTNGGGCDSARQNQGQSNKNCGTAGPPDDDSNEEILALVLGDTQEDRPLILGDFRRKRN